MIPAALRRLAPKLLLSFASMALLVGALEFWAYLWERGQAEGPFAWELVAARRIELEEFPEPPPGYTRLVPERSYTWQGIPVDVNSLGLRSPETTFEKPAGTLRVLNLGDSIAMGWGVAYEDTYGHLLQERLGGETEVINAGVPGWNLENELAYLRAEGFRYSPDVILLDLTLVNDIYGRNALEKTKRPGLIEWLRVNTYLWPYLRIQLNWAEARAAGLDRIDVIDPPDRPSSYFPDAGDDRWQEITGLIAAIQSEAAQRGLPLLIILFPLEHQVVDEGFPTTPQDVLAAFTAQAGIAAVDLLPAFREACLQKPGGPCRMEDRYLFADVWMHPSALGHAIAAEAIYNALQGGTFD